MPTVISIDDNYAVEKSTAKVTVAFEDEAGEVATPSIINWTLTDEDGSIINSREQVSVVSPASTITIVLSGDDLAIQIGESGDAVYRALTIEATYSSDIGADLPLKDQLVFPLKNLIAVTSGVIIMTDIEDIAAWDGTERRRLIRWDGTERRREICFMHNVQWNDFNDRLKKMSEDFRAHRLSSVPRWAFVSALSTLVMLSIIFAGWHVRSLSELAVSVEKAFNRIEKRQDSELARLRSEYHVEVQSFRAAAENNERLLIDLKNQVIEKDTKFDVIQQNVLRTLEKMQSWQAGQSNNVGRKK